MELDLATVYLFLFFVGLFFALLSLVLSLLGGGDFGHDHHVDLSSGEPTAGHDLHFSPFSPQVISVFATSFGGAGYASLQILGYTPAMSLVIALPCGIFFAFLLFLFISKFLVKSQASSESRASELLGIQAEVTTGIPKGGTGEIAYMSMGARYTAPAVSLNGEEISARRIVRIARISAGLFHVELESSSPAKH